MNWADLFVLIIISGFALLGFINGLALSVLRILSFFAAYVGAIKFSPYVSEFLSKTFIYTDIKQGIFNNLALKHKQDMATTDGQLPQDIQESIIGNIKIPEFLKENLFNKLPKVSDILNINGILDTLSGYLTGIIIDIISVVGLFILIRAVLQLLQIIFKVFTKLPVIKQFDKTGGIIFGGLEGILTIFIIFAALMFFNSAQFFNKSVLVIQSSFVAKYFYENNFIVNWMMG